MLTIKLDWRLEIIYHRMIINILSVTRWDTVISKKVWMILKTLERGKGRYLFCANKNVEKLWANICTNWILRDKRKANFQMEV